MPRHKLTDDERRRGQSKGVATKRERRETAEREAREQLAGAVDQAVATLVAELTAEASADRIRAAAQILDRAWGRPRQAHEVEVMAAPDVTAAREKLDALLQRRADAGPTRTATPSEVQARPDPPELPSRRRGGETYTRLT